MEFEFPQKGWMDFHDVLHWGFEYIIYTQCPPNRRKKIVGKSKMAAKMAVASYSYS